MKKFLLFILALCPFVLANAQSTTTSNSNMGIGAFTIGYGFMDVSKMHDFIPSDVNDFKNQQLLIGGEGHAIIDKLVLGGTGMAITGDKIETVDYTYHINGGIGTFDIGYLALNTDKVKIYPMLGVGGFGYGINITRKGDVTKADLLTDPAREIKVSKGSFVGDLSVTMNFVPALNYDASDNSYGGFMVGLKVGYIYSLPTSDWQFSGGTVTGGPEFGLNMPYVKLLIGGFGYQKKAE